jgi:site-specific recombinase XerD
MKDFTSVFKNEFTEYAALKSKVCTRESFVSMRGSLYSFDAYLTRIGQSEKTVAERRINAWIAEQSETRTMRTVSNNVSYLRKFLEYLRYGGFEVFIPQCPKYSDDYVPYLYSENEIQKIFSQADKLKPYDPMYCKLPMILRLLYGCGLRIGETLALKVGDVNFENGTLLLRHAKNNKQRIVPMHGGLTEMLRRYCVAARILGNSGAHLFPGDTVGKSLTQDKVRAAFKNILVKAKIYVAPKKPRARNQCLHAFRHLFAVKSFAQTENIRPISGSVPFLSVYLGHFDMDGTEKYLKFSGDMFPEHTEMFEAYSVGVFSEVRDEE